jgi:hypothetical protein
MTGNLARLVDWGTSEAIRNPARSACGAVVMAFIAGATSLVFIPRDFHNPLQLAIDCFYVGLFLLMAAEQGYLLSRAVRGLRKAVR